ncbi:nucleotidyltransferase family protein [Sphingomonas sp.]|jgi:molybdenum cofactor cytidylyltransferase|uniref:nucleotidyltransferase family protein n=1 Tax=Sphingomonas sp. TaxID=28214 RepID=UPI002E35D258|nr:nucleotidyltransferase family protein [Sphingomonas sp.]HEX4694539.1 nucleotidyltransferase family protein [Sphingomonas sp.]
MIAPETTALILLAAGKSERFGLSDKLTEMFLGHPLGMHAVTALEAVPFAKRIVVTDGVKLDYAARSYEVVHNPTPEQGLSLSVRLGVTAARGPGVEAVLIALADMPRITATQIHRLYEAAEGPSTVVASSDGVRPRPPVLFGAGRFDALERLEGDAGARDMILTGRHVVTNPGELIDVDTEEELAELRAKFGQVRRR